MLDRTARRAVFERYLTPAEEKALFGYVAQFKDPLAHRDHGWMRLLRHTGIRVGSLAGLTCVDAVRGLETGYLVAADAHAKGKRGYRVPLNKAAQSALRDLLKVRRAMGFPPLPDEPLVITYRGGGMSVRSYQSRMAQWREEAGLPVAASPHWFRHTLAKRVIAQSTARDPLGVVQAALGHSCRQSTAVYALPDREEVAHALEEAR